MSDPNEPAILRKQFSVGLDIGQRQDHTALVVTEVLEREIPGRTRRVAVADPVKQYPTEYLDEPDTESVWEVRFMRRLPLGVKYTIVADQVYSHVSNLVDRLAAQIDDLATSDWEFIQSTPAQRRRRAEQMVHLYLDVTGPGRAVCDMIVDRFHGTAVSITFVTLTGGDVFDVHPGQREARLGKAALASQLAAKLERQRIAMPDSEEARLLQKEMQDFEKRFSKAGNDQYSNEKDHDDLTVALALATSWDPSLHRITSSRKAW